MNWNSWFNWGPAKAAIKKIKTDVAYEMAYHMATKAREYAPVDSGELLARIVIVQDGPIGEYGQSTTSRVESQAPHSTFVEFGHVNMPSGTWVEANPFMRKALADTAKAFPEIANKATVEMGLGMKADDGDWVFYSNTGTTFSNDT